MDITFKLSKTQAINNKKAIKKTHSQQHQKQKLKQQVEKVTN